MIFDDSIFLNERQRFQHITNIFMNAFFDCRFCSLFDIKIKLDLFNVDDISFNDNKMLKDNNTNNKFKNDILMIFNLDCDNNKFKMIRNNKNDNNNKDKTVCDDEKNDNSNIFYDDDNDNDSISFYEIDDNNDTNDECIAKFEKTRLFFYRHFIIYIILNFDFEKSNTIFTKITLIQIKKENNNFRL